MNSSSICSRSIAALVACSFAALASIASAQTTATTTPVGYITKTAPAAGASATNTPLSIPLYQTADYQSSIASTPTVGSHAIALTGAAFAAGQFTTAPHLIRVKTSGTASLVGKFWLILSNDATSVTVKEPHGGVAGVADGNLTGLAAGDSCEILPANTLASVFGSPTPIAGLGTGTSAGGATVDNVLVWNGANFDTYFYHSTANQWRKGLANSNNIVIYPDEPVFLVRKVASDLPVTLMGTVPSTVERTEIIGSSNNFVGNRFPIDSTLGATGLETTAGWVKGTSAGSSDNVLLWNAANGNWDTYFFHSTANQWRKGLANSNGVAIPAGTGYFVVRSSGTADSVLSQALPYTP